MTAADVDAAVEAARERRGAVRRGQPDRATTRTAYLIASPGRHIYDAALTGRGHLPPPYRQGALVKVIVTIQYQIDAICLEDGHQLA